MFVRSLKSQPSSAQNEVCPKCNGFGDIVKFHRGPDGSTVAVENHGACLTCDGAGWLTRPEFEKALTLKRAQQLEYSRRTRETVSEQQDF